MARKSKVEVVVSAEEFKALESVTRQTTAEQGLVLRAKIVLKAAEGLDISATSESLHVVVATVSKWRRRWGEHPPGTDVEERLRDAPRSGAPARFTPEQIVAITALACESPKESSVTDWTCRELAEEAVRRGIVSSISPASIRRFLK